ncbi:MAG: PAS domain S-box protein, partial [Candidatus Scalindua sp.]
GGARFESKHRCKDGSIIDIEVSTNYLNTKGGRFFSFIRDITEQKQISQELQRINKQLQISIEQMPAGYILWDKEFRVLEWNHAAERIFGYSKCEVLGKFALDIIVPDYRRQQVGKVIENLQEGNVSSYSEKNNNIRKDGKLISCQWHNTPLKSGTGKIIAVLSMIEDITERKQMEEALLQTEKLRAMGMMTSGVAHDFNNILAIISGHSQLLQENYKEDKELTDIIQTIYRASKDGAEIVRRMRQFTKMERRDTSGFVLVYIKKVLEEAIDFLKPRWMNIAIASGKPFDMDMDAIKEIPSILGKPSELREVFINIINNAMDAMSEGGRLSFRTWTEEGAVFVSITDTGMGMPEDVKKRIFDPFFTTKRAEGSGLGLSEVYGIVTGHSGKVDVSSEVGKGTIFTLKFPIATETIQEKVLPEPGRKITTRKLRILVTDDEKDICNILNTLFSREGHDVKAVTSGKEAIDLIKSEEFDLVLSDLVMPGSSGHDVIQALDELDKRPKVGLITGWKEEIGKKDKEKLNVDFIIKKPFDLVELTKHINDLGI